MSAEPPIVITQLRTQVVNTGQRQVVHRDLSLTVQAGEFLSIVGGSGSGKTVLLRHILGLMRPAAGRVTVLGAEPFLAGVAHARRVGMLFQQGALFTALSVLDNIALPLRELGTLPDELVRQCALVKLRMVGLDAEHANKMPANLSGGMIKRVALARALVLDPELLLLDEPTAGLDPASADGFVQLLRALHTELGHTVVMVTHDVPTLLGLSTRVAVLAERRILICGTPAQVMAFDHPFVHTFFSAAGVRLPSPGAIG